MAGRAERAGTIVLRDGAVVYASEGIAALAGRPVNEIVGRPFLDLLVPEQRDAVRHGHERLLRGEAVPPIELVLSVPSGGRRLVEAHSDRDGSDVLVHVRDLSGREARRLRLEAVASLGAALQRERTEDAVHARVREGLWRLGLACSLMRVEPEGVRILWAAVAPALPARFRELAGTSLEGYLGRHSEFMWRVAREGYAFSEDWAADASRFVPEPLTAGAREAVAGAGIGQSIGVRVDEDEGGTLVLVVGGDWLRPEDGPAVRLFGTQLAAALDAARTVAHLSRRNAQLGVLNRVAELAGEATDLDDFFARVSAIVRPVAGYSGCAIFVPDDGSASLVRIYAEGGSEEIDAASERVPLAGPLGDVLRERAARVVGAPFGEGIPPLVDALGFRSLAWVPLVARSRAVGLLVAGFPEGPAVARAAVDLLSAVGAHCASAIESHGLVADLRRRVADVGQRLADLEAVHVLAVRVHAHAPGDLAALLHEGCRDIARALSVRSAAIFLASDDRATLRAAASVGAAVAPHAVIELARDPMSAEVIRSRVVRVSDGSGDAPSPAGGAAANGAGVATMAVPLGSRGEVRGIVYVAAPAGRQFTDGDVALANALAGALGVGMENAELYAEARRRVEELFLLNEVGRAVAGSLDLDEVLREAAEGARRLVRTERAYVLLYEAARGEIRFGAGAGTQDAELRRGLRAPVPPGTVLDRALRDHRPQVVEDVDAAPVSPLYHRWLRGRAMVVVPVLLRGEVLGVLVADDERGPRRFTDSDVERLTAVADRLAVAIENARLYLETRRRAEELGLLHEVGRSLVETLDIEQVLGAGVRNLARIVDASEAHLALATADGERLAFRATADSRPPGIGGGRFPPPVAVNLAERVFASREPIVFEDSRDDPRLDPDLRAPAGGRAYLALPLVVRERAIGAVVIVDARAPRLFTPSEVERAAAIANQLAVAAENARLYEDLRRSYADLAHAQRQLIAGERLAALGELSAVVAHEVRNPLGVIFNSIGSLRRLVRPSGDAKMLFDIVEEEADRLNRIVGDLLDFARPSLPELRPERLDRVVEDAVASALAQHGAKVELHRDLDPGVPLVSMDARLVRQAVLNVAVNAVQAMPRGGRITIRTRRDAGEALVEIEDDGVGIPEDVRARIFEPFFTTKASGTGLGLAVVKRIVEGHGGAVSVRSAPGVGTVFALRFPLGGPPVENGPAMG